MNALCFIDVAGAEYPCISDFPDSEQKRVSILLLEHQGKVVPLQLADSELQLGGDPEYSKTPSPRDHAGSRGRVILC
jgi:hypothetical protein